MDDQRFGQILFLGFLKKKSSIFKVADRFIFSFNSGEGFSQTESTVQDYIDLVKQERIDFDPKIFSNDEILINAYKSTNLEESVSYTHLTLPTSDLV